VGNERKGFFTEPEIRCVIAALPEHLKDFVLFAYITGMRKGEVQSLRWLDVYPDAITLRPENSKNGEARTIPLEGELVELIERRQSARRTEKKGIVTVSEYVFHDAAAPLVNFARLGPLHAVWLELEGWFARSAKCQLMPIISATRAARHGSARNSATVAALSMICAAAPLETCWRLESSGGRNEDHRPQN
jgi:integrase